MPARRIPVVFAVLFATLSGLAGCGGRSARYGDSSTASDGAPFDATAGKDGMLVMDAESDPRCVVAVRTDECCAAAEPALLSDVRKDPCMELYPSFWSENNCLPDYCDAVDCMFIPPPSRSAALSYGQCVFVDECDTDGDCVLAWDLRSCCGCAEAFPRPLVRYEVCLEPYASAQPGDAECVDRCDERVMCEACPPPEPATCVESDSLAGFNICAGGVGWD